MSIRILVACEESQRVSSAFRRQGFSAFSCDILPTSGNHPEWHIQGDVRGVLRERWDVVLAFPPCTDLAASGARWFREKQRDGRQQRSVQFFESFIDCAPFVCIENPVGIMSTRYRKPDQIIQPWQFGHGETKATCLWLKGLPVLEHTEIVDGREPRIHRMPPSPDRARLRSQTYLGIAEAMADQWGSYLKNKARSDRGGDSNLASSSAVKR